MSCNSFVGTGTSIGDPTEVNSLGTFFSQYHNEYAPPVLLGSVKTNIGHTESAAGVAGLIKVLLMMKHGQIVPSLHVKKDKSNLNPKINLDKYGFDIALEVAEWNPNDKGDRISCVNSFGFGGSNSHAIIIQNKGFASAQQFDEKLNTETAKQTNEIVSQNTDLQGINERKHHLICLSAADKVGLQKTINGFVGELEETHYKICDIAYTSGCHRDHYPYRVGVIAKDNADLIEQCIKSKDKIETLKPVNKRKLIFVFCGVGTTWTGMCKELMISEPVFRKAIEMIDEQLQPLTKWSIGEKFQNDTDYSDPFLNHIAIFTVQVGLFELWKSWGVIPDVTLGQSVGEVAAACTSGYLTLKDAVKVIYHRSKALAKQTGGAMMVVGNYDIDKIEDLCEKHERKVEVAVYSSPTSCTLSGDKEVIQKIKKDLEKEAENKQQSILLKELSVQCAYHSAQVDSCCSSLHNDIGTLAGQEKKTPHISTVTAELASETTFQTAGYWVDNVRKPVRFMQSIKKASEADKTNIFLEIGPKAVLRAHLPSILDHKTNIALTSMGYQKECAQVYESIATLYQMGYNIEWGMFHRNNGSIVPIPKYKFNKSKLLYTSERQQRYLKGMPIEEGGNQHMFIRSSLSDNANYRMMIDQKSTPYVYDHFLHNTVLVPGATYVEAAFEMGQRNFPSTAYEVAVSVEFINPLTPSGDKSYEIELETAKIRNDQTLHFTATKDKRTFAEGSIFPRATPAITSVDISDIREICTQELTKVESYRCLEDFGFRYGESLSLIQHSWSSGSECLAEISVPDVILGEIKATHLHPAIIDAVFQTFGILSIKGEEEGDADEIEVGPTLPKGVGSFMLNSPPQKQMFIYAKEIKKSKSGNHYNALLLAANGSVIAEVNDFYTRTIIMSNNEKDQDLVYQLTWNKLNHKKSNKKQNDCGDIIVLGKQRFLSRFKDSGPGPSISFHELKEDMSDTAAVFTSLSESDKESISTVVFASTSSLKNNRDNGKAILEESKQSFAALKDLIMTINDAGISPQLIVVTECTQGVPGRESNKLKVSGSELWGLVRSAIREVAYTRLRVIDMDLSTTSMNTLQQLLSDELFSETECVIDEGNIFCSKLIRYGREKLDKNQRDLTYDSDELTYLMSGKQRSLESPHFRLANFTKDRIIDHEEGMVQILPTTICLHDREIYPVTCGQSEGVQCLWPDTNDEGFHMLAVEGTGYLPLLKENIKKNRSFCESQKVVFCSPCKAASTVSVPKECILKETWLPFYKPGMITSSVILWSLIESEVEVASVIAIVCDSSSSYLGKLAVEMIGRHTGCFGVVLLKDNLLKDITDKNGQLQYVKSVVMLTKLNVDQIRLTLTQLKTIKTLVTLQYLIPRDIYRQIVNLYQCDVSIQILETENILLPASLKKRIPKVVKWLRSLEKDFWLNTETASQIKGSFNERSWKSALMFPYETFSMATDVQVNHDCKNNLERCQMQTTQTVPLRVTRSNLFRQNGVYIIVGGLTGLGWELLNLMAEMGAGFLVTFSRRAPDDAKRQAIQDIIFKYDCQVICMQTDITDFQKLRTTFMEIPSRLGSVPIRGVFQGGGVLADMLLTKMAKDQIEAPMLPKILGTWNLHLLTKDMEMDFFITHSSIVSIFGNKGQCNYGAGNAFMDSVAHYRRAQGLPGQSINWGALAVGMAVQDSNTEKSLNLQGMMFLNRYDIRTCFLYALMTNEPQITFGNFDWGKMASFGPYPSNLTAMIEHGSHINKPSSIASGKNRLDLNEFKQLKDKEKQKKMFELVVDVVGDVFVVEKDSLDPETTFVSLGIDSMAGMTFVNVVYDRTQVRIPIVTLLSDQSTLGSVSEFLIENLNYDVDDGATPKDVSTQKLIFGKIPFMQQSLLEEYVQDPDNPCWVRMADLEIKGIRVSIRSWKAILNHVLKINPELRRLYNLDSEEGEFDSYIVPVDEAKVELERVCFESIKEDISEADIRKGHTFDLRTQFPVRFKVATEGDCSILRLMIHAVVNDITTWAMLFQDIAVVTEKYAKRKRLPEDKPFVDINSVIQKTLQPRLDELRTFWKDQFATPKIQPSTFYHCIEKPDGSYFVKMEQYVPQNIADLALKFSQTHGITLFQYLVSMYQLLLYQSNRQDYIPVCTPIDMRVHAPELRRVITRCINVCPLVADFTKDQTVLEFIKTNSQRIQSSTQNSAYPYELIQEHMPTDELRNNINRHSLAMDGVSDLNSYKKHDQVKINVRNVWHTRTKYEFTTSFRYDKKTNKLMFDYGYNSKLCGLQFGALIPNRLMKLIERCAAHPDMMISDKTLRVTDEDLGDIVPNVLSNVPGSLSNKLQGEKKDKNCRRRLLLNGGSNTEDVKSKEGEGRGESPTEKRRMSLFTYLRRISKGSLDGDSVSNSPDYRPDPLKWGTYKKSDDSMNSHNVNMLVRNDKNESNYSSNLDNHKTTVISERSNGYHPQDGKSTAKDIHKNGHVNGVQNNDLVNGIHNNGLVNGIHSDGLANGIHSNDIHQTVNGQPPTDVQQVANDVNKPVNVLAKRRPSKPDILDYDNMKIETDPTEAEQDIFKLKTGR